MRLAGLVCVLLISGCGVGSAEGTDSLSSESPDDNLFAGDGFDTDDGDNDQAEDDDATGDPSPSDPSPTDQDLPVATGEPGVWENVTPDLDLAGTSYGGGNYGAQEVFVDPANPNVVYLSVCYQGIWKSADYGLTWTKVSEDGGAMDLGRPWAFGIDTNPHRDPETPPTLYATQGYGPQQGFWRSTDDGNTWTRFSMGSDNDIGSFSVDPNDGAHIIAGMRTSTNVLESTDGGETWTVHTGAGVTNSNHVFFVTSSIWLLVSEWNLEAQGASGTRRKVGSGGWEKVSTCERFHGASQPYVGADGLMLAPCVEGTLKSTDYGATWNKVADGSASAIVATDSYFYVATGWATQGSHAANLRRSEASTAGSTWQSYATAPTGMSNGPHRVTVTSDGTKQIIVSANWLGGVWRYVEP